MNPRTLTVAIAWALLLVLGPVGQAHAGQPRGQFVTRCTYSHSLSDDPIMDPGMPGASHRHDFFGSTRTTATSTVEELTRGGSTCLLSADTAAYWFPTGYLDGRPLVPTFAKAYYFGVPEGPVLPEPFGLQMVAGNPDATSEAENPYATWSCGAEGAHRTPIADHPYDCRPYAARWSFVDSVVGRVQFPNCWDGLGLGPDDMAYVVDRACPPGFRIRLPTFRTQIHFGILDPCEPHADCGPTSTGEQVILRLASGPYFTLHADFWNTWRPLVLLTLVERCLDAHRACGTVTDGPGPPPLPQLR